MMKIDTNRFTMQGARVTVSRSSMQLVITSLGEHLRKIKFVVDLAQITYIPPNHLAFALISFNFFQRSREEIRTFNNGVTLEKCCVVHLF